MPLKGKKSATITRNVKAPAKTNLWLRVRGLRDDGFHEIESRMIQLSLADEMEFKLSKDQKLQFTCSDDSLPTDESNLVVKAVRALESHTRKKIGARIHLEKHIPVGSGLGGGSSDAATTLLTLTEMCKYKIRINQLAKIAASIGSDVPFFLYQQACDVSGRGDIVKPVEDGPLPRLPVILIKPNFAISAAWAYQNLEKAKASEMPNIVPQLCPWGMMENDLERPVFMKFPVLRQMKEWLLKQPEIHAALLSGSGSTVIGILRHFDGGEPIVREVQNHFGEETWTYLGYTA